MKKCLEKHQTWHLMKFPALLCKKGTIRRILKTKLSAASFQSVQIDFYRNVLKPQAVWKGWNPNKNLLYGLKNCQQYFKAHIICIKWDKTCRWPSAAWFLQRWRTLLAHCWGLSNAASSPSLQKNYQTSHFTRKSIEELATMKTTLTELSPSSVLWRHGTEFKADGISS